MQYKSNQIKSIHLHVPVTTDIRRVQMLRQKLPGPYEDLFGPTVLAVMLIMTIIVQFTFKVYYSSM